MSDGIRVLVVEDEAIVAKDIERMLASLGYGAVSTAVTGKAAIHKALTEHPDIVLMDIKLKGKTDGIESAMRIREKLDIPVVYLTAYADQKTLERAKVTDPFGYLLKPFNVRELHSTIEMAVYKHEMVRRLRENEQWLAAVINSIGDGVIASDNSGKVVFVNPVAEVLTGWKRDEAKGKDLSEVFCVVDEPTAASCSDIAQLILADNRASGVFTEDSMLVARDGRRVYVEGNLHIIRDGKAARSGIVVVFRDVTKQREMEGQLRYSQEMKVFGQIAANVAHEVRNPLNAILAITEALFQDIGDNEEYRPYLGHIRSQVNRLARLMKDLLDLGKPLQGANMQREPLEVICRGTIALWNETGLSKKNPVRLEINAGAGGFSVVVDNTRIQQVFMNLLENACHHSDEGRQIIIRLAECTGETMFIHLVDEGGGISPNNLDKVFEPFFTTRRGGTGLGLSIVKHFVESMNGTVSIRNNDPPPGCTVEVGLPVFRGELS